MSPSEANVWLIESPSEANVWLILLLLPYVSLSPSEASMFALRRLQRSGFDLARNKRRELIGLLALCAFCSLSNSTVSVSLIGIWLTDSPSQTCDGVSGVCSMTEVARLDIMLDQRLP